MYPVRTVARSASENRRAGLFTLGSLMIKNRVPPHLIAEIFDYNPITGWVTWKKSPHPLFPVGARAGSIDTNKLGYNNRRICYDKKRYNETHIIWAIMMGKWPTLEIDHINTNSLDNRWENLREATKSQQKMNSNKRRDNKIGFKCITYSKRLNKYRWAVKANNKHLIGKYFSTPEEAYSDYCAQLPKLHGEFANNGNKQIKQS